MSRLVVVVDVQADFMRPDGALPVAGAEALIAPLQGWLASLRPAETAAVLFTLDTHERERYRGSPEAAEFPPHCERGTPGWNLELDPAQVDPAIPTYRLEKGVFDMWAEQGLRVEDMRTGLTVPREQFFAGLRARGVTTASVVGVAADYCVRWAIAGLLDRGFEVEVPRSLTCGISRQIDAVLAEDFAGAAVRSAP